MYLYTFFKCTRLSDKKRILPFLQVPTAKFHSPSVLHCKAVLPNKENPWSQDTWTLDFDETPPTGKGIQWEPIDVHSDPFAGGGSVGQSEALVD